MKICTPNTPDNTDHGDSENNLDLCWQQFNNRFPTEAHCVDALCNLLFEQGTQCRHCSGRDIQPSPGGRTIRCRTCSETSWLTAGTFFHGIRLARPWLAAIWLLEHGVRLSSSKFHKLVGIAYSSALSIFKKLTSVIHSKLEGEALSMSSGHFAALFCKRSRETPAREHPIAEQREMERTLPDSTTDCLNTNVPAPDSTDLTPSGIDAKLSTHWHYQANTEELPLVGTDALNTSHLKELSQTEKQVYQALSAEAIQFDSLCVRMAMPTGTLLATLMVLELAGHIKSLPGDRYIRCAPNSQPASYNDVASASTLKTVTDIIMLVRSTFQGISRKYLQNYLSWHWCQTDRVRWQPGSLLTECIRFRRIPYKEILSYVSPPVIKVSPCSA